MNGKRFAELRRQCGWSQYLLAEHLGTTRSHVFHWEGGRIRIPLNVASVLRSAAKEIVLVRKVHARRLGLAFRFRDAGRLLERD